MKTSRWRLPVALCCVSGVLAAGLITVNIAASGTIFSGAFGGPLALSLTMLMLLACPVATVLMMRQASKQNNLTGKSTMLVDCCVPGEQTATGEGTRLAALRTQREALEREVANLQAR